MLDTERIVELYQKMKSIGMTDEELGASVRTVQN